MTKSNPEEPISEQPQDLVEVQAHESIAEHDARIEQLLLADESLKLKSDELGRRLTAVSSITQRSRQFIYGIIALTIVTTILAVGVGLALPRVLSNTKDVAKAKDVSDAVATATHDLCFKVEEVKAADLALWTFILTIPRDPSQPPQDPAILEQFNLLVHKFDPDECP